jgi:hypothetical protein
MSRDTMGVAMTSSNGQRHGLQYSMAMNKYCTVLCSKFLDGIRLAVDLRLMPKAENGTASLLTPLAALKSSHGNVQTCNGTHE